jgi:hypothetical protein
MARRFPPPWSVEEHDACFVVRDHSSQKLAYIYFEDEPAGHQPDPRFGKLGPLINRHCCVCVGEWPKHPPVLDQKTPAHRKARSIIVPEIHYSCI